MSLLAAKMGNTETHRITDVNSGLADGPERGAECGNAHEILLEPWLSSSKF